MKNKVFPLIVGILMLFSACNQKYVPGSGEGVGIWPSRVLVDSTISPAGNKVMLLELNMPAHRPSSCESGELDGAYIGIEFSSPLPGGTTITGNIPEIGHTFTHVMPAGCDEHWQYWMQLPDNWQPGQLVSLEVDHASFNVQTSRVDGLVIIANIDAQDDISMLQSHHTIPLRGPKSILGN